MKKTFEKLSDFSKFDLIYNYLGKEFGDYIKQKFENGYQEKDIITDGQSVYSVVLINHYGVYAQYLFRDHEEISEKVYELGKKTFYDYYRNDTEEELAKYDSGPKFIDLKELLNFKKIEQVFFLKGNTKFVTTGKIKKKPEFFVSLKNSYKWLFNTEFKLGKLKVE